MTSNTGITREEIAETLGLGYLYLHPSEQASALSSSQPVLIARKSANRAHFVRKHEHDKKRTTSLQASFVGSEDMRRMLETIKLEEEDKEMQLSKEEAYAFKRLLVNEQLQREIHLLHRLQLHHSGISET